MSTPYRDAAAGPAEGKLGTLATYSVGIGGIVGGGIFATIGLAGADARGAAVLSFLLGGFLALITAYSYVRLTLAFPGKGGTVTFLSRAFGDGLLASGLNTMLVLSYVMVMALYASTFGNYGQHFFAPATHGFWQPALTYGVLVVLALVNLVGPRLVERSEGVLNLGKLAIILFFIAAGLSASGLTLDRLGPVHWAPPSQIAATAMVVFLSYEGFELIANASDRITDPRRTLPFAYYGSVSTAIVLYVLMAVVTIGHLDFAAIEHSQAYALATAADAFLGHWGFLLLAAGAVLAAASAINADLFGASKLPVMLAERGEMPSVLGREVWRRYPASLALLAVLALVIIRFLDLHAISTASSAGFIMVFAMVNLANARLADAIGSRRWLARLGAIACFGALAAMLYQLTGQAEHHDDIMAVAALAVLPFLYQIAYRATRRRRLGNAKAHRAGDRPAS